MALEKGARTAKSRPAIEARGSVREQGQSKAPAGRARESSKRAGPHASKTGGEPPKPRNRRLPAAQGAQARGPGARARLGRAWSGSAARLRALGARLRRPAVILLRIGGAALALAGLWAGGRLLQHHLTTSPAFAIEDIEIEGLKRMERAEVLETAGIDLGQNVFAQSPEAVRARLLAHPWVAAAEVTRRLPGQFTIALREREPAALLLVEACSSRDGQSEEPSCDDPSSLYLVSEEGHVFKRLEGEDPVDLPVITGIDRARFGAEPDVRRGVLLEAVALLSAYRSAGLKPRLAIGEIHIEPNDALSIYVGDELTLVRLGHSPFDQKLRRMKKVFDRLEREHASADYVYLDNERRPDRVTVRLR
jgi:cell division protein FtsQ